MFHLRFLPTDGSLVPITASTKVLLLGSQHMLECAHVRPEHKHQGKDQISSQTSIMIDDVMFYLDIIQY